MRTLHATFELTLRRPLRQKVQEAALALQVYNTRSKPSASAAGATAEAPPVPGSITRLARVLRRDARATFELTLRRPLRQKVQEAALALQVYNTRSKPSASAAEATSEAQPALGWNSSVSSARRRWLLPIRPGEQKRAPRRRYSSAFR